MTRLSCRSLKVSLLVPILLTACAQDLHIRQVPLDSGDSPSCYATYRWDTAMLRHDAMGERVDPSFDVVIRQAVDAALRKKGYSLSADADGAMILSVQLTVREDVKAYPAFSKTDPEDESLGYGLHWRLPNGSSAVNFGPLPPSEKVSLLAEGTLHIGAFNPRQDPLWHVMGHKVLERDHHSPERHVDTLRRTVQTIMADFPDSSASSRCP